MILQFIEKEKCLILAVSPANADLANSDALKLAREVDPDGLRTISVLTKLDLMDKGTDAREILENKLLPLKRGYIGVVNRSQQNINDDKNIVKALADEKAFFQEHSSYRHIADRMGTAYLQKTLNADLTKHIHESLPGLRAKLNAQIIALEKNVELYSRYQVNGDRSQVKMMIAVITDLQLDFECSLFGSVSIETSLNKLSVGARMNYLFHEKLRAAIFKIDNEDLNVQEIAFVIKNVQGVSGGMYTPESAFEVIVKKQIDILRAPMLVCVEDVVDVLTKALDECTTKIITRYPKLRVEAEELINCHLRQCSKKCCDQLMLQIDLELSLFADG